MLTVRDNERKSKSMWRSSSIVNRCHTETWTSQSLTNLTWRNMSSGSQYATQSLKGQAKNRWVIVMLQVFNTLREGSIKERGQNNTSFSSIPTHTWYLHVIPLPNIGRWSFNWIMNKPVLLLTNLLLTAPGKRQLFSIFPNPTILYILPSPSFHLLPCTAPTFPIC